MDMISNLPDDLLLRILSLLPNTKDVVATMVLSKRWKFFWMFVLRLVYDDSYQNPKYGRFSLFVNTSLFTHKSPVLESLHFKLGRICGSRDIQEWIRATDSVCVRQLIIDIANPKTQVTLPWTVYYWGYRMLVTLKLSNSTLMDYTSPLSFPYLKKLSLESMKYPNDEFVKRLLSSCHVLEDLFVEQCSFDNVNIFTVIVSSLKSLVLKTISNREGEYTNGFVIDAPSLEYLNIFHCNGFCVIENNMTKIQHVNLAVNVWHHGMKFGSVTSIKRLYLCVPIPKDVYPIGSIFCSLVYLKICTCETEWMNLLMRVIKDAPKLQALKLSQRHILRSDQSRPSWNVRWNEVSSVPECLVSSLKTFEWVCYEGNKEEKELAIFILRNASCLKKATFISSNSVDCANIFEMRKELFLSLRRLVTCQFSFS